MNTNPNPINQFMEKLANLAWWQVLIIVAVLLVIRYILGKQRGPTAKSIAETAESLAVAMALVFFIIRPFIVQAFYIPSASMHPTLLEQDHILVNKFIYRFKQPKLGDVVVFKSPPEAQKDESDFIKRVIGVPGDTVRITPGYVLIGNDQYNHAYLRELLGSPGTETRVKLVDSKVFVNGTEVSHAEVAAAAGVSSGKVKVVPGEVYINDKPLVESYTAEDPDGPYPMPSTPSEWIVTKKIGKENVRLVKIPPGRLLVMGDNRNDSNDARFWGLLDRRRVLGKAMFLFWPIGRMRVVH